MWESGDINTGFQQGVENGVDNLHLPKITALEKAVGNFRERLQSFFSKKERSNFLFLRLLSSSKRFHVFRKDGGRKD